MPKCGQDLSQRGSGPFWGTMGLDGQTKGNGGQTMVLGGQIMGRPWALVGRPWALVVRPWALVVGPWVLVETMGLGGLWWTIGILGNASFIFPLTLNQLIENIACLTNNF